MGPGTYWSRALAYHHLCRSVVLALNDGSSAAVAQGTVSARQASKRRDSDNESGTIWVAGLGTGFVVFQSSVCGGVPAVSGGTETAGGEDRSIWVSCREPISTFAGHVFPWKGLEEFGRMTA